MRKLMVFLLTAVWLSACTATVDLNRAKGKRGPHAPDITPEGVAFAVYAPQATLVTIAANFNGWNPRVNELTKNDAGVWTITVPLKPGKKYYYKFLIDGFWVADPDNPNTVPDGFSGVNSVVEVPKDKK